MSDIVEFTNTVVAGVEISYETDEQVTGASANEFGSGGACCSRACWMPC